MGISRLTHANPVRPPMDWKAAFWLWPYLVGMALLSHMGEFGGGRSLIPFYWDLAAVAAWSLVVYLVALRLRLPSERVDASTEQLVAIDS